MIFKEKVGLGTSIFGARPEMKMFHERALDTAINIGYRMFDTAETYGHGQSEMLIGNAIKKSGLPREQFEIVTKLHPAHNERISCQASLDNLQVDYVDAYLVHFLLPHQSNDHKISSFIAELVKLKQDGLIKNYGFSNFSLDEINMWLSAEERLGVPVDQRATVCQYQYNLVKRNADVSLHTLLKDRGITAMPHSPFGGGFASGSSRPPQPGYYGDFWQLESIKALAPIAEQLSCTVPQLILAFLNRQPNSVIFPRSFKQSNLVANFESSKFIPMITESVCEQIDKLFPVGQDLL